jgi:hypothetical protein
LNALWKKTQIAEDSDPQAQEKAAQESPQE